MSAPSFLPAGQRLLVVGPFLITLFQTSQFIDNAACEGALARVFLEIHPSGQDGSRVPSNIQEGQRAKNAIGLVCRMRTLSCIAFLPNEILRGPSPSRF